MNGIGVFVHRPIGTALLAIGLALSGWAAFLRLPVAPLPQVEYPTLSVKGQLPGADPQTVANALTSPLERQLGHIAGLRQMSSSSMLGASNIVLQFELGRDIDAAARDVQSALDAARGDLPADMPLNPVYAKSNPADAPLMLLSLTSPQATRAQMYELASSLLQQRLMRVEGVGDVTIGGGALPAVRVELDAGRLARYRLALEDVRRFLRNANVHLPLGSLDAGGRSHALAGDADMRRAADFQPLAMTTRDGSVVHLTDFAQIEDSVEDVDNHGLLNGQPAVLLVVFKQSGANVIEATHNVVRQLTALRALVPADVHISVVGDRTQPILAALDDVGLTLLASAVLVVAVTFVFSGNWRAALVPALALPLSLLGTFVAMYALGFSLNLLTLMGLAIATGFVVDDAIVVTENIMRHIEHGRSPLQAALAGTREIAFTVLSISVALIAVFLPLLLMGGLIGRLFREFAVTLAVAVLWSMVLSLTLTPTVGRLVLRRPDAPASAQPGRRRRWAHAYDRSLRWTLRHPTFTLAVAGAAVACNLLLLLAVPKGFFPQEDIDKLAGVLVASQDTAFPTLQRMLEDTVAQLREDPDVENVVGFVGAGQLSSLGTVYVYLRKRTDRTAGADELVERLTARANARPDSRLYLQVSQNLVLGGRRSPAQYQLVLSAPSAEVLNLWSPRVLKALRELPAVTQLNTNRANRALQRFVEVDRVRAQRLGVDIETLDQTLYDAFGQRRVSTLYLPLNQFRVVMEVSPEQREAAEVLDHLHVSAGGAAAMVPLSAMARFSRRLTPQLVSHSDQYPSETISFNLAAGHSLGKATQAIAAELQRVGMPPDMNARFTGTAQAFEESLSTLPWLVGLAVVAIYLVLGMLYESLLHPLTILSTLPSAGLGALTALLVSGIDLSAIAVIGIVLLIGIVMKNAIMLVDFALAQQREHALAPDEAMHRACTVRLRPILMTTAAALLGAVPLVIGHGYGSEFRRPLGVSIIGGLVASQLLTLYTTPAVYIALDRLRGAWHRRHRAPAMP